MKMLVGGLLAALLNGCATSTGIALPGPDAPTVGRPPSPCPLDRPYLDTRSGRCLTKQQILDSIGK
jgi:hypothetical protein